MNYLIVDDEALARRGLERYGVKIDFLHHVGSCENALEATTALEAHPVDLLFLDVQMPQMTGIEFLRGLRQKPLVILHTAYPNFALEGYELDVIDYLVKPTTFDRFFKAVTKAREYHKLQLSGTAPAGAANRNFTFVKCEGRYEKIDFDQLLYVEALQNYSIFHTQQDRFVSLISLRAVEDLLPAGRFYRTHKSYVVALNRIDSIDGNSIYVNGKNLPIGREQRRVLLS